MAERLMHTLATVIISKATQLLFYKAVSSSCFLILLYTLKLSVIKFAHGNSLFSQDALKPHLVLWL